jgi:RNA recognition motif-containing protein
MDAKVYVAGLSHETTEESLRTLFSQAGTVKSVHIATDRDTGDSKGFGFVEMSSPSEMETAIQMFHGKEVDGRTLVLNPARPGNERSSRNQANFAGGRGGFGSANRGGFGGGRNTGWSGDTRRGGKSGRSGGRRPSN